MRKFVKTSIKTLMVFSLLLALGCSKSDKVKLKVGQAYQGGIIAYVDATGKHGLIAALNDQSTTGIQWGDYGTYIGATGLIIGTGKSNTTNIVQFLGAGNYAAKLCDDLVLNGYSDWFLPSKDELNELYKNKELIGDFANAHYWSSSETNANYAWGQHFSTGYLYNFNSKHYTYRVRAVRTF